MNSLRQLLPPLDALVVFEAAARHGSFTGAASELNVTQSAVSRQIRLLEEHLGKLLFVRAHRKVELTHEGRDFQHTVALVLRRLALVTQEFRNDLPSAKVTIAAGPSISTLWLMPRLAAFRQEHPHLGVRIITTDVEADFFGDEVDVAIIYGRGPWRGYAADLLLEEEVFPVCSPGYRAAINLNSIGDFANATLIDLENEQWDCVNWRIWLAENGASHLVNARRLHINNYPLVIQAARDGHGVALGWRYLVDSLLQDGALVCPVGERLRTGLGYHVIVPAGSRASDEALLLREWILSARV